MDFSAALPTFVITLREGVEAALVVGIVLAYLNKADRSQLNSWVYAGVGVGVLTSALVGVVFSGIIAALDTTDRPYGAIAKQFLEAGFGVVAIALLSWMLIWMTQQAKAMKGEVEGAISSVLKEGERAGWGIFGLVAIAVLREGFETVVFIAAQFQQGWMAALGAVLGLVGAVGVGIMLFRLGIRINLKRFFQVMGVFLLLIVAGLVVSALRHLDAAIALLVQANAELTWLCREGSASCILGAQVWDASQVLPDRQFPGIVLKALFGYTQHLYLVQAIAYVLFLSTVGSLYLSSITGWKPAASSLKSEPEGATER